MLLAPFTLFAHAFGQTYTLPVPLWLFLFGAGATVAVSFFAIGLLTDARTKTEKVSDSKKLGFITEAGRFLGVLLLALTIITGLAGAQESFTNFSVTFFWVIFLLGLTYVVAIFGNVWEFINPFSTLFDGIESLIGRRLQPRAEYPRRLGYYPALIVFYGLIWLELVGGSWATTPRYLALIITAYTAVTLLAVYWYGREAWFRYGELFSVFFGLVSKVSPVRIKDGTFSLRRPLKGLVVAEGGSFSLLLFILFMLASTGFDGFRETSAFGRVAELLPRNIGSNAYLLGTIGLVLAPFVLLVVYLSFVALMKWVTATNLSVHQLAYRFAFSLIPIAVAYHAAHYFTMLLITGQGIIPALSDPFDSGLNLFGTADYKANIAFLSAFAVWYTQVALIVIGHMAAVYVAHMEALELFGNRRQARLSQVPMVALMVLYTAGSLWIIAQPIVI